MGGADAVAVVVPAALPLAAAGRTVACAAAGAVGGADGAVEGARALLLQATQPPTQRRHSRRRSIARFHNAGRDHKPVGFCGFLGFYCSERAGANGCADNANRGYLRRSPRS